MLGNLAVLHTPQVIVAGGRTAKGALADGKDEVTLRQNHVDFIVHHGNTLLRQSAQRGVQTGYAIGNAAVVLDVIVTVKIVRSLIEIVALHDIVEEILDQLTVFLGLVQIPDLHRTVRLSMTGGIRLSQRRQIVPMLGDLAVFIETEDVKGNLLTGTGEIVHRLQEHLVAVLKSTDVVHRGFYISGCKIFYGADEGVRTGAVCQIVLDVAIRQQAAGGVRIAGGKGVDERQCLFGLALLLLGVFSGRFGSSVLGPQPVRAVPSMVRAIVRERIFFILSDLLGDWACFCSPLAL